MSLLPRLTPLTALLAVALGSGCDLTPNADKERAAQNEARSAALLKRLQAACSSPDTYDRLKQVAFDQAIQIRNADPRNLDILASRSEVRMEDPVVVSRDETLDVTVCKGRFILEIPPGAEAGFGGERRLVADVEYSAQRAADGTGLVYAIRGAEPIVYKLAAFDLKGQAYRPADSRPAPQVAAAEPTPIARPSATVSASRAAPSSPAPARQAAAPPPPPAPPANRQARAGASRPSFNCRYARTSSERMVCGSDRLASLDRAMSAQFYSALSSSNGSTRAELRRSRDRFLAYRDRCPNEACVAAAYRDRMDEISDIAGDES